jgi:23S rRNA (adenine2503-C2)-methyltransferase
MYRNLTSEEMVKQALTAAAEIRIKRPLSVTFSGMGEPLLNLPAVTAAANKLCMDHGFEYASLSTVVIPQALERLAQLRPETNVFVSLHATEDGLRRSLIPSRICYPIFDVLSAAEHYARNTGRRVKLSYLLLGGINDSHEEARRLGQIADPEIFIVQLLLWNEIAGMTFTRVGDAEAEAFATVVRSEGAAAYVMRSAGRDVAGGCGQFAGRARGV